MLNSREDIAIWLNKNRIQNYTINDDLTVDVDGNANISHLQLEEIPFQFGVVSGSFKCYSNKLKSLKGSPRIVGKSFYCYDNLLESLEYCPEKVTYFDCSNNDKLKNLIGSPKIVSHIFTCGGKYLESVVVDFKECKQFICLKSPRVKNIKGLILKTGLLDLVETGLNTFENDLIDCPKIKIKEAKLKKFYNMVINYTHVIENENNIFISSSEMNTYYLHKKLQEGISNNTTKKTGFKI